MDNVQKVKEKIDIVDLIGSYITLSKAGENFKGKCPFHNEKTPSFMVSPIRQSFYCFGCGTGGDIFTFIEKYEGLEFRSSLQLLADRAGVTLENLNGNENRDDIAAIYNALETAALFFSEKLRENSEAMEYLKNRGLTSETIESFRLGFAPKSWNELGNHLAKQKIGDEIAHKAGLLKKKDDRYYDTFRSRIMFPIFDAQGRVVAFSGRIFGDESEAKYLNSPETVVFTKGEVLYGFDRAKGEIRRKDYAILVEGQFDLVMAHQAGFINTVASSGTAFNEKGLSQVGRLTKNLMLVFDADAAGIGASGRVARIALPLGFNTKSALLPKGSDPAEVLHKEPKVFTDALKNSKHIVDFYLDLIQKAGYDERKLNLEVSRIVLPYVVLIENMVDQAYFVRRISDRLKAPESSLWVELAKIQTTPAIKEISSNISPPKPERTILDMLQGLLQISISRNQEAVAKNIRSRYKEITGTDLPDTENDLNNVLFELDILIEKRNIEGIVNELLNRFELEYLTKRISLLSLEIKRSEEEGKDDETAQHLLNIQNIIKRIDELKKENY